MSRPWSDEERRALDMRRIEKTLDEIASAPIDELGGGQLLAELDSALIPGNMRRPSEVLDNQPRRIPTPPLHHALGDADIGDDDETVDLLPYWGDESEPTANSAEPADAADTEPTHDRDSEHDKDPDSPINTAAWRYDPAPLPDKTSVDTSLSSNSALRDILGRRPPPAAPTDYAFAHSPAAAEPPALAPNQYSPPAAERADGQQIPEVDPNTASTSTREVDPVEFDHSPPTSAVADPPPVPLRSKSSDSRASSVVGAFREKLDELIADRTKLVKLAAIGVGAVIVLAMITFLLPEKKSPSSTAPANTTVTATTDAPPSEIPVPESAVGILAPSAVTARCPDGSTDARFAFTADKSQAWICKRALGIDGAVMEMTFPKSVVVTDVFMVPGFDYVEPSGIDRWGEHRAVTRVQWTIGSQRFIQEINPSRAGVSMKIPSVETNKITLTIMTTAETSGAASGRGFGFSPDTKEDSFAISTIRITGHQP